MILKWIGPKNLPEIWDWASAPWTSKSSMGLEVYEGMKKKQQGKEVYWRQTSLKDWENFFVSNFENLCKGPISLIEKSQICFIDIDYLFVLNAPFNQSCLLPLWEEITWFSPSLYYVLCSPQSANKADLVLGSFIRWAKGVWKHDLVCTTTQWGRKLQ